MARPRRPDPSKLSLAQIDERIAEVQARLAKFEELVPAAQQAAQFSAAVTALQKAAVLESELDALRRSRRVVVERDPYARICLLRDNAVADGSHVAAARYESLAMQERARMSAEEERRRAHEAELADWDTLWEQIAPLIQAVTREQALQIAEAIGQRGDVDAEDLRAVLGLGDA